MAAFEEVLREWVKDSGADLGSVVSVDGKTLRGIHGEEIPGVHLVSAYAAGSTLVRWAGHTNVAAALRRHAAHVSEAFALVGISPSPSRE